MEHGTMKFFKSLTAGFICRDQGKDAFFHVTIAHARQVN
jgi:cold shock CspA family protein